MGTAKMVGNVADVWAGNDLVVTAESGLRVSVFNAYNGMNPVLIAQVPTPGVPQRVAVSGNYLAVAAGEAGLLIIDLSTPAEARIVNQLRFGNVTMVVASDGIAYVGQTVGTLKAVELTSGRVLGQTTPPGPLRDLALAGDHLYARTDDQLFVLSLAEGGLAVTGSANGGPAQVNARLFVGGGTAWSVDRGSYDTFDVSDPAQPRFLATASASFF
ncbi:MAG: hypothetical protein L0Z50_06335, partial [Verrucomicrobiales bacterium]|nr:hypothetical protein [Verrucomicrobiales bacterium]